MREKIWTEQRLQTLLELWPHFGTYELAKILNLRQRAVKGKADKLRLTKLPQEERMCIDCRTGKQDSRSHGQKCKSCFLQQRRDRRMAGKITLPGWIKSAVNTARYRSKLPSDLTSEFMVELWNKQEGLCFYSGVKMAEPIMGGGRNSLSASIDRIDPKLGYTKNNVVWCTWICNAGKSDLSVQEYLSVCQSVVDRLSAKIKLGFDPQLEAKT